MPISDSSVPLTLVLGASPDPERYSNLAIRALLRQGQRVYALGRHEGGVEGVPIQPSFPKDTAIDTITLYLNPKAQEAYYTDILQARPRRIIFNPGAENPELARLARQQGIQTRNACTLVLLSTGQF